MCKSNAIILFDGVCNLCNGFARFILRHDKFGHFKFAALQSNAAQQLLERFALRSMNMESVVLVDGGRLYTGSDAGLHIFRRLNFPWNLLSVLAVLPRFIRDGIYNFVARNRYKWFGRQDNCMIPDEKFTDRWLT